MHLWSFTQTVEWVEQLDAITIKNNATTEMFSNISGDIVPFVQPDIDNEPLLPASLITKTVKPKAKPPLKRKQLIMLGGGSSSSAAGAAP